MAESAESLFRRGEISARQAHRMGILKGTRLQPSKMANFDDKSKTDAKLPRRGPDASDTDSINKNQREGSPIASKPTRGGGVGGSKRTPTTDAINQGQNPKFPAGDKLKGKKGASFAVPKKIRGTRSQPEGGQYGGPNSQNG